MLKSAPSLKDPQDAILLEPFEYLCQQPGKEVRSQLIEAFDHWLHVPHDYLQVIKRVVEMLHNASLLIDDVEDNSILRRGKPVAHKIYGQPQTINCANFVYFLALKELQELEILLKSDGKPPGHLVSVYTEELLNLHRGQGMDIYWRDQGHCPTEQDYIGMIKNKTGGLLRLAIKLMLNCCPIDPKQPMYQKVVDLVGMIGVLYQVRDDYINLQSVEYMENKSFCEDLTEGKYSFPIIHSIRSGKKEVSYILKQRTTEVEVKRYAVQLMTETASFEYTRAYLRNTFIQARTMIQDLEGNELLSRILDLLSRGLQ